ncbi:Tfp pilus assembly protein FimT/FimU [Roseateles saccharophilus]|uniref:Type II secretion system protein H n=1 Tax=Roseateles saccharophilus TaxID=304 RepID=A0A4R3UJN6_ROSSA|nr:GspH/FimT family pseudopilin [Roseateles saccharophilus]TCU90827.1 type IV fimbrial biogenesis protein FimT [Roseateles saccharophilus]
MLKRAASAGFGLIEMLVAISIMVVMAALALPSLSTWVSNARMRAVADALQAGLHVAQTEAQRRSNTVVVFMTGSRVCDINATATASGAYWQARLVPDLLQSIAAEAVQCGALPDVGEGVTITASSTALCFGADGRQTTVSNPASIGVDCTAATASYLVQRSGSDRRLQLNVSMAGSIRVCDPDKASTAPDGCR